MSEVEYVLGHGERELRRLELQSSMFEPATEHVFHAAGLQPGMHVLDIGAGSGDVSLLAGRLTAPHGTVLGIDREANMLTRARARVQAAGLEHVRFEGVALDAFKAPHAFDFVVARYVLMHQADPVAFLRSASAHVKPGGVLAVLEPGMPPLETWTNWSHPEVPLYSEACTLIGKAFASVGADVGVGARLVELFDNAGLPEPGVIHEVPTGGAGSPIVEWCCLTLLSLLPRLETIGITSAEALGVETLQARMQKAVAEARSQVRLADIVGAWTRLP